MQESSTEGAYCRKIAFYIPLQQKLQRNYSSSSFNVLILRNKPADCRKSVGCVLAITVNRPNAYSVWFE